MWPRALLALCGCACLGPSLEGAIAGLPQPPTLTPASDLWADTGNDNISDGVLNHDDYRTGTIDAGYIGARLAFAANASVLTDRSTNRRTDQLTSTIGCLLSDRDGGYASAGIGVRAWGDFGGQSIQNHIHQVAGYPSLDFSYDDSTRIDALGYVCGRYVHLVQTPMGASWLVPPGRWGVQAGVAALGTSQGDVEGEVEVDALFIGERGRTYLGLRLHDEGGNLPGSTARVVAARERGWWLMAGCGVEAGERFGINADVGIDPHTRGGFGRIGIDVHPAHVLDTAPREPVEVEAGFYSGSVVGVQLRWQPVEEARREPRWMQRAVRSEVLLEYRFGGIAHAEFTDVKATSDQLLVGHALTLLVPDLAGLRIEPYGYGAVGVRAEQYQSNGPNPAFAEVQAIRGVAQCGIGVRLGTDCARCAPAWRALDSIHLGAGIDRFFPWREADVMTGQGRARLQRPGTQLGVSLGYAIAW